MDPTNSINSFSNDEHYLKLTEAVSSLIVELEEDPPEVEETEFKKYSKKWDKKFEKKLTSISCNIAFDILRGTFNNLDKIMRDPTKNVYQFSSNTYGELYQTIDFYGLKNTAPYRDWYNRVQKELKNVENESRYEDLGMSVRKYIFGRKPEEVAKVCALPLNPYFQVKFNTLAKRINDILATQIPRINDKLKSRFVIKQELVTNQSKDYSISISLEPSSNKSSTIESTSESSADE